MVNMHNLIARSLSASHVAAACLVFFASFAVSAQTGAPDKAPQVTGAPATLPATLSWSFGAPANPNAKTWTAERGTLTVANGEARLQPDANRRVVLLSPADLPAAARNAEQFVVGIQGTGLQRVRVQARRDARGGWITIADATGTALRETAEGYAIQRKPGARDAPIERLRIEFQFRTTNPRTLQRIAAGHADR